MSDQTLAPPDAPALRASAGGGLSAGAILRAAREGAGLHIGALAVALKVPVKKLEALESDQLDLLPDAVFARALASSICRTLKLDPRTVLSLLPGQVTPALKLDPKVSNASFDTPGMGWRLPLLSRLPKPVIVTASLLLVAALVLLFVPSLSRLKLPPAKLPASLGDKPATKEQTITEVVPAAAVATSVPAASAAVAASTPPSAMPVPSASSLAAPLAAVTAASGSTVSEAPLSDAGIVVFKTRGTSWVEVSDAGGVVQLRKTLGSGESAGVSGALPLSVTIGRADSIEVLVRGKSFDLTPFVKDNVARFKVK